VGDSPSCESNRSALTSTAVSDPLVLYYIVSHVTRNPPSSIHRGIFCVVTNDTFPAILLAAAAAWFRGLLHVEWHILYTPSDQGVPVSSQGACKRSLEEFQILIGKILTPSSIPPIFPRCLFWYDCQTALVDESGVISSRHHHHHSSPFTREMNKTSAGGRSSETVSPPHNQSIAYVTS
jgi:hypothetical protein